MSPILDEDIEMDTKISNLDGKLEIQVIIALVKLYKYINRVNLKIKFLFTCMTQISIYLKALPSLNNMDVLLDMLQICLMSMTFSPYHHIIKKIHLRVPFTSHSLKHFI